MMRLLTIIKTITKAAPLALFGVVISASAFAGGKGPKNDPQASIEAYNVCKVKNIYNSDTYSYDPTLVVKTKVKNTSGDTPVDAELSEITVQGSQKARGQSMDLGGAKTTTFGPLLLDNYDDFKTRQEQAPEYEPERGRLFDNRQLEVWNVLGQM
jgi:hypothetical protein